VITARTFQAAGTASDRRRVTEIGTDVVHVEASGEETKKAAAYG
jgi:hypothetical protein